MTAGKTKQTKSTSAAVESRPSEKRTSELAVSFRPVAKTTWLGSSDPAEHAEPLEAQMPSMSKPAISAMPSEPRTTNETVFARHFSSGDTNSHPGIFCICSISRRLSGASFSFSNTGGFHKLFQHLHQSDNGREIFRAGAALVFMPATKQNRVRMKWRFDEQQPCALRSVKFVRAH